MVDCLCQLAKESELILNVPDHGLSLEVIQRYALLEHLNFLKLLNPLEREVLARLRAFNECIGLLAEDRVAASFRLHASSAFSF